MIKVAQHIRHLPPLIFEHRLTELTYFVTDICNMKCRHCFVHEALNNRQSHLALDDISRMAKHIPAMQRVHLGGGEPFTRSDIAELAVRVSNEWKAGVVCVPTNGWFTDRILGFVEHFGAHGKGNLRLHFSINSPDPTEMDHFTQLKGSLDRWRRSIDQALVLARRFPQITIVALATFNEYNQYDFEKLIDFVHEDVGVDDFSFHLSRTHEGYAPPLDMARFRAANAYYFRKYNRQNPLLASFREQIRVRASEYYDRPEFSERCTSGKIRVVMSPAGDVYPCEKLGYPNLEKMDAWKMGNIRDFDHDINALLRSTEARALYGRICDSKCHCDHNIDHALGLMSRQWFRQRIVGKAIAKLGARPPAATVR